jgi:hypothetical protein
LSSTRASVPVPATLDVPVQIEVRDRVSRDMRGEGPRRVER